MDVARRFWSKVDRRGPDECWLWQASTVRGGYGLFKYRGRSIHAHRWAHFEAIGQEPDSRLVDHRIHCDRRCVNPRHLRSVTRKQNAENRSGPQRNSASGVRGVYWHKGQQKWCAKVKHNQRNVHVGTYVTLDEAERAVKAKRLELFSHSDGR